MGQAEHQYHKRPLEQECKVVKKDCDFSDGLFFLSVELLGQKYMDCVMCCPTLWGVAWSVSARILPIVANNPNFSLSCAHGARCARVVSTRPLWPFRAAAFAQWGGGFARGEFGGENFAIKKGGEFFPWRNFGSTAPSFITTAGIVFSGKGQARLRTYVKFDNQAAVAGGASFFFKALTILHATTMEGLLLSSATTMLWQRVTSLTLCLVHVLLFCDHRRLL